MIHKIFLQDYYEKTILLLYSPQLLACYFFTISQITFLVYKKQTKNKKNKNK